MLVKKNCNIDKTDRINRIVIGFILIFAAILGMSWMFFLIAGLVLVVEGICGRCYIPKLINKATQLRLLKNTLLRKG